MPSVIRTGPLPVMGWEKITVSTTAIGPSTASIITGSGLSLKKAGNATITIETASIRATFDGTTPVDATNTGHVFAAGTVLTLESYTQIQKFKMVRVGGTDATVNITYWEGAGS